MRQLYIILLAVISIDIAYLNTGFAENAKTESSKDIVRRKIVSNHNLLFGKENLYKYLNFLNNFPKKN